MRIKLAILENDEVYLNRLKSAFSVKYSDKLEIYSFTEKEIAIQTVIEKKIDVFLVYFGFGLTEAEIPASCGFAYLTDTVDVETINNRAAICKFQKAETIYRQVLGIFSERAAGSTGFRADEGGSKILSFVSAGGGSGSSTAAVACAMNLSQKGNKTLYLNLEKMGSADVFFHADGNSTLGDIIYSVKSKKGNLALKLESTVKKDISGVYFYSSTKTALDVAELNADEVLQIVNTLRLSGAYDYIILDMDLSIDREFLRVLAGCDVIAFVSDGSQISNTKLKRALESINIMEQQSELKILMKSGILYNRFGSHTSQKADVPDMKEFGGINRYEGYSTEKLLQQLSTQPVFDTFEKEMSLR